jgi:DNA replicative helicase MCM subunit Mcm2 (Cdc46/Mcm family)
MPNHLPLTTAAAASILLSPTPPASGPYPQPYSAAELREFVAFARARIQPSFSPAAEARLIESYKELRRNARNENVSPPFKFCSVV